MFYKKIMMWFYLIYHRIMINIGISLYNTEIEILRADPNIVDEKDKHIQRKLHRNQLLEKFYAGKKDEKYMENYYEILRRSKKFLKESDPNKIAATADKHGNITYGQKDKYGRRKEHFGFFDEKHKHSGKTIGEVLTIEMEERRTKDDDYQLLRIYDNKPINVGLVNIFDVVEKTKEVSGEENYKENVFDILSQSKQFKFPIRVLRKEDNNNVINKIEELTEFLHIKKIGFEHRQLEFFIPLKYKTNILENNSDIIKEIITFENIFINDEFGELQGYGIVKFMKRIIYNDTHEVFKFEALEMENVGYYH